MAGAMGNQSIIKRPKTPRADGHQESRRREREQGNKENEAVEGMEKKKAGRKTDEREKMEGKLRLKR